MLITHSSTNIVCEKTLQSLCTIFLIKELLNVVSEERAVHHLLKNNKIKNKHYDKCDTWHVIETKTMLFTRMILGYHANHRGLCLFSDGIIHFTQL